MEVLRREAQVAALEGVLAEREVQLAERRAFS